MTEMMLLESGAWVAERKQYRRYAMIFPSTSDEMATISSNFIGFRRLITPKTPKVSDSETSSTLPFAWIKSKFSFSI